MEMDLEYNANPIIFIFHPSNEVLHVFRLEISFKNLKNTTRYTHCKIRNDDKMMN